MPDTTSVSQADIDALAQAIAPLKSQLRPTAMTGQSPIQVFCQSWTTVKPILEALQPVVTAIPGIGAVLAGAIGTVLLVGNGVAKAFCGAQ